jgi:adenylate cyclase
LLLCGAVPVLLAGLLALYRPAVLGHVETSTYDSIVRRAGTQPPGRQVAIVDVDDRSLTAVGQWPWRRDLVARLIERLQDLGASAIAMDLIFAEPDRFEASKAVAITGHDAVSPESQSIPPDTGLADALRRGRVVLGYALTFEPRADSARECILHPLNVALIQSAGEVNESPLFRASGAVCSLPLLGGAAGASGFLNATADPDGILRRAPLLLDFGGNIYPALGLAAVIATTGTRGVDLRLANVDAATLTLDGRSVPLDGKGNLLLRYRGKKKSFPYVSAADVLEDRVPTDLFKDAIVFVGATALGTGDSVSTPIDTQFAGVELHATVADNLLRQDFFRRSEHAAMIEMLTTLIAGIGVTLVGARLGLAWGGAAALAATILLWGGSVWRLSASGVFVSPLFPTVGIIAAFAGVAGGTLLVARRHADRSRHETVVSQHLMVQSLLSLTEARDPDTGRHARRTQHYTRLLAKRLASHPRFREYLTPERIELLASLAPLHDIGKVAIPDRLLNKPGALTVDEIAEMRNHPTYGLDVILQAETRTGASGDPILAMAKDIVYTHHERWDGTGYPRGLVRDQIPIPGRLVALVDVYDALVTQRVYRQPMPPEAAINLIVAGSGTLFDPAVVEAFLQVVPVLAVAGPAGGLSTELR